MCTQETVTENGRCYAPGGAGDALSAWALQEGRLELETFLAKLAQAFLLVACLQLS